MQNKTKNNRYWIVVYILLEQNKNSFEKLLCTDVNNM